MFSLFTCSFKLCKRVLTKDLLCELVKCGVGTNEVEKCVENLSKSSVRRARNTRMIRFIMGDKLLDAKIEEKRMRKEYEKRRVEFNRVVPIGSEIDTWFRILMRIETEKVWKEGKAKNKAKIYLLNDRYKPKISNEAEIRNVMYRDIELDGIREGAEQSSANKPRLYGGVQISEEETLILSKDPSFMLLERIDRTELEIEIEKGLAKARYELMGCSEEEEDEEDGTGRHTKTARDTSLKYASMRATDIPTVARLCPPRPSTMKKEKVLESVKSKMLATVSEYQKKHCDKKGRIKKQNIDKSEEKALREVKEKVKKKEMVVFTTDKSGRFAADTPQNYEEAVMKHTQKDELVGKERVRQVEGKMNQHMKQFNKMFRVGAEHEHERRVESATHSTNTPAPPLYGLRKDHKTTEDAVKGPPVRPVCGANQAPNSRLSGFLSRIVNDHADAIGIETECRSSEEMRAGFEEYNDGDVEMKRHCAVISMDVKALYPSMEWGEILTAVRELVESSPEEVEGVDYEEIGKYIAVTMKREDIVREGLANVVPERKIETGRDIGVAYLCNKANDDKWKTVRKPGKRQRKKMVALAVMEGVRACMSHHVYRVGDKTFLQKSGGPIGLELTGAVSRAFMWRWDRLYLEKVERAGLKMRLYERYVDDSNQVAEVPAVGTKYVVEQNKLVVDPELRDHNTPADERVAKVLLAIANSVMDCIEMEGDWPSKNEDGKMPILDMKVWVDTEGTLLYKHYEKKVSSKTVLNAKSAHSAACKRSVHTQEVLRRMLNTSHRLSWKEEAAPAITEYMGRMKEAGYGENYRKDVLTHALQIYDKKWEEHRKGSCPIFRHKSWKSKERREDKRNKRLNWASKEGHIAPIFVPTTPGGTLMKMLRKVAEEEEKEGIKFKIMEVGGRTMKREVQRSNPTATQGCVEGDCIACNIERGKGGDCRRNNVNYEIECQLCPEGQRPVYIGETARNLYTRAKEHMDGGKRKRTDEEEDGTSFVRKHMDLCHKGSESKFKARVTKANTDSFSRQIREGVLIRRCEKSMLNSKSEWFQPPIFQIRSEIIRE